MYLPLNNGLRFHKVDAATLQSLETDWEREAYGRQGIYEHVQEGYLQPVDWADQSRVQAISPTASPVTVSVRNPVGAVLATIAATFAGTMVNDPSANVFNATIEWAAIAGLEPCSFVIVQQGLDTYKSEPLRNGNHGELLKLVYANLYDHKDIGSYRNCFEMFAYVPGRLINPEQPRELAYHTDSQMRDTYLSESHFRTRLLDVFRAPHYLHLICQYALRHDKLEVFQKWQGKAYRASWQWVEQQYNASHAANQNIYRAETTLKKVADRVRAIASAGESQFAVSVNILPPTNIISNGFTANWTGQGDSYDVQLATDSEFTNIVTSLNTTLTSQSFSGLTSCQIYYYRVRAVSCEGAGAWSQGETIEQVSVHFRGDQNFSVWEASEKVANLEFINLFANLQGVRFKFAPLHGVLVWGIYPFRTLSQIQADITAAATTNYSVFVEIDSFAQGSEGLGILQYRVPFVRLAVGCLTYGFRGVSQDHLIGFDQKVKFNSVSTSPVATLSYAFVPNLAGLRQLVVFDTTLAGLNLQIASHAGSQYAVAIFIERALNVPQNTGVTATINIEKL